MLQAFGGEGDEGERVRGSVVSNASPIGYGHGRDRSSRATIWNSPRRSGMRPILGARCEIEVARECQAQLKTG